MDVSINVNKKLSTAHKTNYAYFTTSFELLMYQILIVDLLIIHVVYSTVL
jgi:hypothetical protein